MKTKTDWSMFQALFVQLFLGMCIGVVFHMFYTSKDYAFLFLGVACTVAAIHKDYRFSQEDF